MGNMYTDVRFTLMKLLQITYYTIHVKLRHFLR